MKEHEKMFHSTESKQLLLHSLRNMTVAYFWFWTQKLQAAWPGLPFGDFQGLYKAVHEKNGQPFFIRKYKVRSHGHVIKLPI